MKKKEESTNEGLTRRLRAWSLATGRPDRLFLFVSGESEGEVEATEEFLLSPLKGGVSALFFSFSGLSLRQSTMLGFACSFFSFPLSLSLSLSLTGLSYSV